jgi:hypothetical protein
MASKDPECERLKLLPPALLEAYTRYLSNITV